jgi:ABC-type Zn uptake system ZnuABC Zn-binding protein ZnuA
MPARARRLTAVRTRPELALVLALVIALVVAACGSAGASPSGADEALKVVTTTTVFADLVTQVGGPDVTVHSLVPKGGEVHTFDPTPRGFEAVARAQLLVANGLGLDDWLVKVASDAGTSAPVVTLADGVPADRLLGDEDGTPNPHLWLDVSLARLYVAHLADALATADPAHGAAYGTRASAYDQRLATLDTTIRDQLATVPADDRNVISFHDAFPYFAHAYGLEVVGTIVDAPGQDPSAGEVAKLVDAVKAGRVAAIVAEAQFNADLVRTLADETGARVVTDLYDDTLSDPPVDSYEAMLTWDAERLTEALSD